MLVNEEERMSLADRFGEAFNSQRDSIRQSKDEYYFSFVASITSAAPLALV